MKVDITKELFTKVINDIVASVKCLNDLYEHNINIESFGFTVDKYEDFVEKIFGLPESTFSEFTHWLATGAEMFIPSFTADSEIIEIRTIDDLWNFIIRIKGE